MSVRLMARVMGESEEIELHAAASLAALSEWVNDETANGGAPEDVELWAVLPGGERVELDHEERWFRRVETTDENTWRTLCQSHGLTVAASSRVYGKRREVVHLTGCYFNGARGALFVIGERGHVEVRLTDEEVSRER